MGGLESFIGPALMFGSTAASLYGSHSARDDAKKANKDAEQFWKQNAFPKAAAVNAQSVQNRGQLGQDRLNSYNNLAGNLATRGFGPSSGMMEQGGRDIESAYIKSLGQSATDLTKFSNTPQWAPPGNQPLPGGVAGGLGDIGDTAMGMLAFNQMFGGDLLGSKSSGINPYQLIGGGNNSYSTTDPFPGIKWNNVLS